jgi:hypothetical protein
VTWQQRRRRGIQRPPLRAQRHLLQIRVVEPQLLAVGDDELPIGFAVVPAKPVRARQVDHTARLLHRLALLVEKHLPEPGFEGAQIAEEAVQPIACRLRRAGHVDGAGSEAEHDERERERA